MLEIHLHLKGFGYYAEMTFTPEGVYIAWYDEDYFDPKYWQFHIAVKEIEALYLNGAYEHLIPLVERGEVVKVD